MLWEEFANCGPGDLWTPGSTRSELAPPAVPQRPERRCAGSMRSPEPCSHTRGHRRHWVTLARAQADATVGRSLIQIRSDAAIAVQGQSPSPLPPAPHAWAGAGWAPVLRKPGNTLFSGLHAQIPGAVTGHAFSEPIQSHKHGPEASLGSGILWGHQQGHLDSQAHSWLGREVPADSQQAGAVVRSCGV